MLTKPANWGARFSSIPSKLEALAGRLQGADSLCLEGRVMNEAMPIKGALSRLLLSPKLLLSRL